MALAGSSFPPSRGRTSAITYNALSKEEAERVARWEKLKQGGLFQPLSEPSAYLQSYVVARKMAAQDNGEDQDLPSCLEEAAERGHPALAEEATKHLEDMKYEPKARRKAGAEFSPPEWRDGIGHVTLHLDPKFGIDPIPFQNHQGKLSASDAQVPLGGQHDVEERQCPPLRVGIGVTLLERPKASIEELHRAAAILRVAQAHLGDAPSWIPETEHFLRQNIHDCVYLRHEKDYRVLQHLSQGHLEKITLAVLRLSYFGRLEIDLLHGGEADERKYYDERPEGVQQCAKPSWPARLT